MQLNKCAKAFVGPITDLAILTAAQETVLQGKLLKNLVLNFSVAPAAGHFQKELQVPIRKFEILIICLA